MNDVQKELERFRSVITKDWARTTWDDTDKPLPAVSRLSGVAIACRHFAIGGKFPAEDILRIAAEVTGLPMEEMTDASGNTVKMWWPVHGEVGWLPYQERPMMWTGREWKWDDLANRWVQPGAKSGSAISTVPVGA